MPIRTRTRYPGDIDPALGQTVATDFLPHWVSGRFYEACCPGYVSAPATFSIAGTNLLTNPFIVPHPVAISSIGVEVTSAATAGNTMRLGLYDSDPVTGWPNSLLLDSGPIAIDATGFRSASIALVLHAGLHWAAHCATGSATYREYANTSLIQFIALAEVFNFTLAFGNCIAWNSLGGVYSSKGLPLKLPIISNNTTVIALANNIVPRILIGV